MKRPIIFGEILFDCFPDGSAVCSGAPLNVCRNLKYLGYEPLMVSRVGSDELGDAACEELSAINLELSGIQRDATHPTSRATVTIENNEPSYHFTPDSAWDHMQADEALSAIANLDAAFLYTGTLALRSAVSCQALDALLEAVDAPLFFDANLRSPWWERSVVDRLLERATWLKCNEEEYATLFADANPESIRSQYKLNVLILTKGSDGAAIYAEGETATGAPPELGNTLVDTVGAGDAFASAVIHGLDKGHALQQILTDALDLGAEACRFRGADWKRGQIRGS